MPEISVPLMGNAGIRAFTPKELPCPRSSDFTARFAPALLPWPPRVRRNTFPLIPVVFAFVPSVQLLDFESHCPLLRHASLIYGFLFVRSVVCHGLPSERASRQAPCPSAGGSRFRALRGLSPPCLAPCRCTTKRRLNVRFRRLMGILREKRAGRISP